jgi:hypothetical protein
MEVTVIVESRITRKVNNTVVTHTVFFKSCRTAVIAARNSPHPVSFPPCMVMAIEKSIDITMLPERLSKLIRILKLM